MKKLFLLFVVIPFFGAAQNNLVKWFRADLQPTLLENHISSTPVSGVMNQEWGSENAFYSTNGNFTSSSSPDLSRFIQFTVGPENGYQIKPTNFSFNARSNSGSPKFQVRYSKNENFSNPQILLEETSSSTNYIGYNLNFPSNTKLEPGEKLYIRLYVYQAYDNLHIQHNLSGSIAPSIYGTVSLSSPVKPNAFDDHTATLKNTALNIDVLGNDDYMSSGILNKITPTKPLHGTVTVNSVKDITYTPDSNYVGYDSFYYTLTNAVGESNSAKVDIQVIDGVEQVLVRWNKSNFSSTSYTPKVVGEVLKVKNEFMKVTQNVEGSPNPSFEFTGLPTENEFNGKLDPSKYLSMVVKLSDLNDLAYLTSLKLKFRSGAATGNITIKYSKNSDFSGAVVTLLDDFRYTGAWLTKEVVFPSPVVLLGNETLYFRIYAYNTWNPFFIDFIENGEGGPAITGIASVNAYEPCAETVTWNGTAWNGTPDINKKAVINGDYNTLLNGDFEACSLKINAGKTVVENAGYIILANSIAVNSGATFLIKSDGNFLQNNNAAENTGEITVERTAAIKRLDYVYWASPVKNQNLKSFSPGTVNNRFYTYNEGTNLFDVINPLPNSFGNSADGNFESAAKGYAIRANNSYPAGSSSVPAPTQIFTGIFTGVPNNGRIIFPLAYKSGNANAGSGNNLVGNPYASNIDFNMLVDNNSDLIEPTAYLWTNLNPNPAMQGGNYPNGGYFNNYATLNKIGGIPATKGKSILMSDCPTQIIKVGQAFIVKAKKTGELIFTNDIRTKDPESVFINKSNNHSAINTDRFWLHLKSPMDVVTTTLIGYREDAQDSYNKDYDARLLVVGDDAFYSQVDEYKLGIQGRQGPLRVEDVVQLGMNHYESGIYTVSLGQRDGIFADNQAIYLKDKQNGIITNLSAGDYTFTADAGASTGRFEIIYRQETTLATQQSGRDEVIVYRNGGDFTVKAPSKINDIEVYDLNGRLIFKVQPQHTSFTIPSLKLSTGVYLIKVTQKDNVTVKKIMK